MATSLSLNKRHGTSELDIAAQRTFWVIYILDKEYSFNSNKSSVRSSGELSCHPLPLLLSGFFSGSRHWALINRARTYPIMTYLVRSPPVPRSMVPRRMTGLHARPHMPECFPGHVRDCFRPRRSSCRRRHCRSAYRLCKMI